MKTTTFGLVCIGEDFCFATGGPIFRRVQGLWAQRVDCIGGHRGVYGGSTIRVSAADAVLIPTN